VCEAFKAYFPRQSDLPSSVRISDQMLTIWPLEAPDAPLALADDCRFAVDRYDLYGGQSAIGDAQRQGGAVSGEGPFLIGWSPSNSRGVRDRLVLVVDLSGLNSQESINQAFHFWQLKVVEDPALWRRGFSPERLRLSLRDFLDRYGSDLLSVVKITGLGGER
jgi:hypothetical protein